VKWLLNRAVDRAARTGIIGVRTDFPQPSAQLARVSMADDQASSQSTDELASAIALVKQNPKERQRWELVEDLLESAQRPADVSELFRSVLGKKLSSELLADVGQRGVRFYETWFGEDSKELREWLERVLHAEPKAEWAFERLTVAYTVAERWPELLDAYDGAIAAADQTSRRMRLLEEAAQVAKDFAGLPERAIGYMLKLHALDPDNATLASGLERLLERQERWEDLVALWQSRLAVQSPKQARESRLRMAGCYLDKLGRHGDALEQVKLVLADAPGHEAAYEVLERVLGAERALAAERQEAQNLLKQRYLESHKPAEVVRVLELGLGYADDVERRALLRELVERLIELGDDGRAMKHQAALLALEPLGRERVLLRTLAERTRDFELFASALVHAAERCKDIVTATELLLEAARTQQEVLGDESRASALYERVFRSAAPVEMITEAGRKLIPLLEKAGREAETLEALSRMSELEREPQLQRSLLGRMAKLAEKLGDKARADQAWQARLNADAEDLEALDALVTSAAEQQQWQKLAALLEQRIAAPGASARKRKDLVWLANTHAEQLADPGAAIEVWRRIVTTFGEDTESVTALTDLLSRAERWRELADVLSQAAARQIARFTELQTRLGDAYRERLDQAELAAQRYRSALQVDPRDEAALRGQHALLGDERCRATAVESLVDAYGRTGDWKKTLELLEPRLSIESSETAQAEILLEAAELYEERAADPRAALGCLRRGFALIPDDRAAEREVRRLAEKLGAWDAVVAAYRETIASFVKPTPRVAELRYDEGRTLEERLDDHEGALTAYAQALAIAPERIELAGAATRVAAELGRWDDAAKHALTCIAARGALVPELLAVLEGVAAGGRAWEALGDALTSALAASPALDTKLARQLHARVASWHVERRKDEDAAEAALLRAVQADGSDLETLRALAQLQRRTPGEPLCRTLLALADLARADLDPLLEAADVAREAVADRELRLSIWQVLYDRAAELLRGGAETSGQASAAQCARFALEQLVTALGEAGAHERAFSLLASTAALPFDADLKREDLHRAARIVDGPLADAGRATALYRDLLQSDPGDRVALAALGRLYQKADRLPELLSLKRHELALERDAERQLGLRLEIAALLGELETRGGRLQVLQENLRARPGHAATLAALQALLAAQGRHAELAELLRKQAKQLARGGETERAAELVEQAATLYERELSDVDAAIAAYSELNDLDPAGRATAALARLYTKEGQHAEAAKWLELRLGTAPPDTRAVTSVELAHALLEAGERERARTCLEQALQQDASLRDARELLAGIYRADSAFEPLAALLTDAAAREAEPARKLALLREAASLYCDTLQTPERAVSTLEQAYAMAKDDRELQAKLADALTACGRFADARAVFERLIEGFGRKRSVERAELHYRLARVAKAEGDATRASEELETASKMDPGHVSAMHMLAELSREQGDLDRAERTYRGLLMLVRRQKPGEVSKVGQSEIFYALSVIATEHGHAQQAGELLESAMEAATQNDAEARRFQRLLRERGKEDLLMRLLEARMKLAQEPAVVAEILALQAEVLAETPKKRPQALEALLQALALTPDDDALHLRARKLAVSLAELDRYLSRLSTLADEAARRRDDASQNAAARLTLRLGEAIEQELADLDRAAGLYAKVESSGRQVIEAWMAMARVAGARGDVAEQRRVLARVGELGPEQVSAEQRRTALFALAELELAEEGLRDAAVATLERALGGLTDFTRAKTVLRAAVARAPGQAKLALLFERVARAARDNGMLLEHFERRAAADDASVGDLREGIELALRGSEHQRAEALLQRAAALADQDADRAQRSWVFSRWADCRKRAGDLKGALLRLQQAVDSAEPAEVETLCRELAELAAQPGGDLEIAAASYARLLERDPTDRELWLPLLHVYRRMRDRARFEGFVEQCLRELTSTPDRVTLHMERANFAIEVLGDERAAVPALKALLDEEPSHAEATDLLTQILQKHGMNEELAELLQGHFDRARDEQNLHAIAELGLRIGDLYGERRPDAALDTYRSALQWVPEHGGLLRALLERLGPDAELRERAEVMHALLKLEQGEEAARLALQLAPMWSELYESEQAQQALEIGLLACPTHDGLRDRLEGYYAEREMWRPLAELLEREAARLGSGGQALARLKNAASLYREHLHDLESAASALRHALELAPEDLSLLGELARNLAASGQQVTAIADVTRLLDGHPQADGGRVDLLKVRAELRLETEDLAGAVSDLEEACAIAPGAASGQLIDALERQKTAAFTQGDAATERKSVMRLCELHDASGDAVAAREALSGWVDQAPEDIEALRALAGRDTAAARWEDVIRSCERLLDVETGPARVATAIALADACAKAGRPAAARDGLERVRHAEPANASLRARLRELYESIGEKSELAAILLDEAKTTADVTERVALFQRAARLHLENGDAAAALLPLGEAVKLQPEDAQTQLLMIDLSVQQGNLQEAEKMLDGAIAAQRRKRSPELAALYQRMARLCAARADSEEQIKWLNQAIEIDRKSGEIASELAEAALAAANYDVAMKALRAITMMDDPLPITRAMAFLKQAQIAQMRGDPRRAQHWARKAKSLDEGLSEADTFLAQLEV
jgi:tetratricopeptide (TPR) repeat protein